TFSAGARGRSTVERARDPSVAGRRTRPGRRCEPARAAEKRGRASERASVFRPTRKQRHFSLECGRSRPLRSTVCRDGGAPMRLLPVALLIVSCGVALLAFGADKQIIRQGQNPAIPVSPAVKAGNLIYVSGALATDASGKLVPGDVKAQTRKTIENIAATLKAGGSSLENVASVNVYLKSPSDFQAMNQVYRTFFPNDPPPPT